MSVSSVPPLANGSVSPWWVCPPDRELALRAKIRTGFSTVGSRVRNDNKTFVNAETARKDSQLHAARSFHSSFKMSPSLYRRLSSIQNQRTKGATNGCKHCDCGGMVSESSLTDEEIESIKKVVARAEAMDKADEIRIGCLILQFKELQEKCAGNGTSNCILCNENLTLGKNAMIETCNYCEKAVCTRCRVQVDVKLASGQPVICCKVCGEEQELWRRSGAWINMRLPEVMIPEYELRMYKTQLEQSKMPILNRGYSLVEAPVGESVRSPSICSDVSEESELDISNALLKFSFSKPDSVNNDLEASGTKTPQDIFSPSPTLTRTHTVFDEVEETSQAGLEDLLQSRTLDRREGSPLFRERINRLDTSSIKRTGAVRKSRKSKSELSRSLPPNLKYRSAMTNQPAESYRESPGPSTTRDSRYRLSGSPEKLQKPSTRRMTTPERDGELSHSSESLDSSSESELGDPLIIASTPSDGASNIIGIVPDIVVQEPPEGAALGNVEGEDSLSNLDIDKSIGLEGDQHDMILQELDQEQVYRRPRSYAVLTRPGGSPIMERKKMYPSSDEEGRASSREGRASSREGSVEKWKNLTSSGGIMKDLSSSDDEPPFLRKSHTSDAQPNASWESTTQFSHPDVSCPSSTTAIEYSSPDKHSVTQITTSSLTREGFSHSSDAVPEPSTKSSSPESFPHAAVLPENVSSLKRGSHLSSEYTHTPPSTSVARNGSDKSLQDAPEENFVIAEKGNTSDLDISFELVSKPTEHQEELSLDPTPPQTVSESLTITESIESHKANAEERSEPSNDSASDVLVSEEVELVKEVTPPFVKGVTPPFVKEVTPPFVKEVEHVEEIAPQPGVEEVSQPEVGSLEHARDDSTGELSVPIPRPRSLANGKEVHEFRRRGATRLANKQKESSPSLGDRSAMTVQEKAKMVASRIRSDRRHISTARERHQNDVGLDPNEEMVPYSGSSDFKKEEEDEEEQYRLSPRRRRDRVRNVRQVQRSAARLSSSRRRQYEERDHNDF